MIHSYVTIRPLYVHKWQKQRVCNNTQLFEKSKEESKNEIKTKQAQNAKQISYRLFFSVNEIYVCSIYGLLRVCVCDEQSTGNNKKNKMKYVKF